MIGNTNNINSRLLYRVLLFLFVLVSVTVRALPATDSCRLGKQFVADLQSALSDVCFVGEDLITPGRSDLILLGGSVAATTSAILWDEDVRRQSFRWQSSGASDFFAAANNGGEILYASGFAAGLYAGGLFGGVPELRRTGRLLLEAYLVGGLTVTITKYIIGRARPYNDLGNGDIRWFQAQDAFQSMPSGHTAVAFATATVLGGVIDRWWAYVPLYSGAAAVGLARIYKDKHWLSDVVLGATIGTFGGIAVLSADRKSQKKANKSEYGLGLYPALGGFGLAWKF